MARFNQPVDFTVPTSLCVCFSIENNMEFDLSPEGRKALWATVTGAIEDFYSNTGNLPVAPVLDADGIRNYIRDFEVGAAKAPDEVLEHILKGMREFAVHTPHPAYFGLFNPRPNFPGILADALVAAFNPQLAAWSHAPFAVEVEQHLVRYFGQKFGYPPEKLDGVFTTGGAEANLTALLCALTQTFPKYAISGLYGLQKQPVIYCSAESHHSIVKSVRIAGMGSNSVRTVPVDHALRINTSKLLLQIENDRDEGYYPLMIIATAGTTGAGTIDPLNEIAQIAEDNNIWLHVDAAYGGGLVLSSMAELLTGIEKADSITFDAHKLLSAPMGTSMFLTRHKEVLSATFRITAAYMPKEATGLDVVDPFVHSIQWSRRFNGLKLYLSLLLLGEESYRTTIDNQLAMGRLLRQKLVNHNWEIYNGTELPVICFSRADLIDQPIKVSAIAEKIIKNGKVWLSVYPVAGKMTFRVCITNYNTGESELDLLISELDVAVGDVL
jgi:glutamate/tyrosine decarboxylase-like PLP-dependent enzyme